jgi:hypothetical protein
MKHKPEEWPTDGDATLANPEVLFVSPSGSTVLLREKLGERLGWESTRDRRGGSK